MSARNRAMAHFLGAALALLISAMPFADPLATWVRLGSLVWFVGAAWLWMRLPDEPS